MKKRLLIDIGNSTTRIARQEHSRFEILEDVQTIQLTEETLSRWLEDNMPCIVASVVPEKDSLFASYPDVTFINHQTIAGITVNLESPEQVGADRLAAALAAYSRYQSSCLIIDFGTALTFCLIDERGCYQGGAIVPGFGIASKALNDYTSKIPLIYVEPQDDVVGKNTEQAVQIGLYQGYKNLIKGMIEEYKKEKSELRIIGTGAGLACLKRELPIDDIVENLVVEGLSLHPLT